MKVTQNFIYSHFFFIYYLFSYENKSRCSRFLGKKKQARSAFTVTNTGFLQSFALRDYPQIFPDCEIFLLS